MNDVNRFAYESAKLLINFIPATAILLLCAVIYFFPYLVARHREHRNRGAILITNLFFGWTFLGWVAPLIWAMTDNTAKQIENVKIVYVEKSRPTAGGEARPTTTNDEHVLRDLPPLDL